MKFRSLQSLDLTIHTSSHAYFFFFLNVHSLFLAKERKIWLWKECLFHPKTNYKLLREVFLSKLHLSRIVLACHTTNSNFENLVKYLVSQINV